MRVEHDDTIDPSNRVHPTPKPEATMKTRLGALMLLLLGLTQTSPASATGWTAPVTSILGVTGVVGAGADNLNFPNGVTIGADRSLYVADTVNHRVQRFNSVEGVWGPGTTVAGGNGTGPDANQLHLPKSVAVDGEGTLYIADTTNHRVQKVTFDSSGGAGPAVTVAGISAEPGTDADHLAYPNGVAVDSSGALYIADTNNHRIQKITFDSSGQPHAAVTVAGVDGQPGSDSTHLKKPRGVALDALGTLYVADSNNHRIQKIEFAENGDAKPGQTIAGTSGQSGSDHEDLSLPTDVVIGIDQSVYFSDYFNHRVQKVTFTEHGEPETPVTVAGTDGEFGSDAQHLWQPIGLAFDAEGALYISDTTNHRVQRVAFDTIAPSVGFIDPGLVRVGSPSMINFGCDDEGGSGVSSCAATLDGEPFESGYYLDADAAGLRSVVLTASDNAGNSTTGTFEFLVHGKRELTGTFAHVEGVPGVIARLYMATFTREPETDGFNFWTASTVADPVPSSGPTSDYHFAVQTVANYFATSPEFQARYGDRSNAEFVDLMYANVMIRQADAVGRVFWLEQLDDGMTQAQMLLWFAESPEFKSLTGSD